MNGYWGRRIGKKTVHFWVWKEGRESTFEESLCGQQAEVQDVSGGEVNGQEHCKTCVRRHRKGEQ